MPRSNPNMIKIPLQEYQEIKSFLENFVFDLLKKDYINMLNKAIDNNVPVVETFIDSKMYFIGRMDNEPLVLIKKIVEKIRWEDVDTALKNHVIKYRKEKLELEGRYA